MKIYRRTLTFSDWCISWDRPTALIQNFKFQSFKYGLEIQNKVYLSHILQPSPGWLALLGSFTPSSSVGSGSFSLFLDFSIQWVQGGKRENIVCVSPGIHIYYYPYTVHSIHITLTNTQSQGYIQWRSRLWHVAQKCAWEERKIHLVNN